MPSSVLVITYYYPPLGGVGVQRVTKFVKYLGEFGWEPLVVAPQPSLYYAADPDMLDEVKHVQVFRGLGLDSFRMREKLVGQLKPRIDSPLRWVTRRFSWPDTQTGYIPAAFRTAYQLTHKVRAIFVTAPPWSNMVLGRILKRITNLPLIIDMRDPWCGHPVHDKPRWKRALNKRTEREILEDSDAVVAATRVHTGYLIHHYPHLALRIKYIPNGYDARDFTFQRKPRKKGPLVIAYTGILGLENINRGTTLYSAIRHLRDAEGLSPSKLRVHIMGEISSMEEERIRRSGVSSFIERLGHLPHRKAMQHLERADLAWLPYHAEYSDLIVPAKTYEYIGSGTPILATVNPSHETAALVRETGTGLVAREGDVEGVTRALKLLLDGVYPYDSKKDAIAKLERRCQTGQLAKILDDLTAGG